MIVADPWFDYLALPIAPLVLFLQFGALFLPRWWQRAVGALLAVGSIVWMERYVVGIEVAPEEGVNIGAGLLALWLAVSLLLLAAAAVVEVARVRRPPNGLLREDA